MLKIIIRLGSLNFAISLISGLALILTLSTLLESIHGTPFAQENFYQAHWFDFFLGLVWVNIFCATLTRFPFKKKHLGFVITHLGILTLLIGCLLTRLLGQEGQLTLFENETNRYMTQSGFSLRFSLPGGNEKIIDLKAKENNRRIPLEIPELPFKTHILRVIPHGLSLKTIEEKPESKISNHALKATLSSQTFGLKETFSLIEKDPQNELASSKIIGPAKFILRNTSIPATVPVQTAADPVLRITQERTGQTFDFMVQNNSGQIEWKKAGLVISDLKYFAKARVENNKLINLENAPRLNPAVEFTISDAEGRTEHHTRFSLFSEFNSLRGGEQNNLFGLHVDLIAPLSAVEELSDNGPSFEFGFNNNNEWFTRSRSSKKGLSDWTPLKLNHPVSTGWMDMTVTVENIFNQAQIAVQIKEDPLKKSDTPLVELAIKRQGQPEETRKILLGQTLLIDDKKITSRITCAPKTYPLPFSLRLNDFRKIDYPGTSQAASYESDVALRDPAQGVLLEKTIQMNKPLDYGGYRIFQSSYIQDPELGEASVFSIAKNPGISLIYLGAILIFIGVILLFYFHPFFNKTLTEKK